MSIEIRPVSSRRDLTRFIKLPWKIYRNEPRWVPPLVLERRRYLDRRRNPFFEHAEAEYLLAWRDGEPVGRISAHIDRALNEYHGNRWGLFGFFECEDDEQASAALIAAAEQWLSERGADRIVGPVSFTMNDEAGLLVEGHEHRPLVQQPWQHPYYARLLEGSGLAKAMDLLMWNLEVSDRDRVLPVIFELAEKLEPEHGIVIRHMRKRDLEQEARRFVEVYNAAWSDNWGFVPMTDDEMIHAAKENKVVLDENWMMIAEKDGETVGAALTVPDFNQVLATLDGRLLPFGWLKILARRRQVDRVRVGFLGVKPEYQHTGVAAGLYVEHFEMAASTPQTGGEMGWILETNTAMNRGMEAMGGRIVKRYRIYDKELPPPAVASSNLRGEMPEPADSGDRGAEPGLTPAVSGEVGALGEVRHLPVLAPAPEPRAIDRVLAPLPAPVVAATGGFLAGVFTFFAARMLGRRRSARALTRGARRGRELDAVATRSFLVDIHLLKR